MPCLVGCMALVAPRLTIILVAIFSRYLHEAYETAIWPIIGFFVMPMTTLAYAWAWHFGGEQVRGAGVVVVIVAVLIDLGLLGGSGTGGRKKWRTVTGRADASAPGRVNVHVRR